MKILDYKGTSNSAAYQVDPALQRMAEDRKAGEEEVRAPKADEVLLLINEINNSAD